MSELISPTSSPTQPREVNSIDAQSPMLVASMRFRAESPSGTAALYPPQPPSPSSTSLPLAPPLMSPPRPDRVSASSQQSIASDSAFPFKATRKENSDVQKALRKHRKAIQRAVLGTRNKHDITEAVNNSMLQLRDEVAAVSKLHSIDVDPTAVTVLLLNHALRCTKLAVMQHNQQEVLRWLGLMFHLHFKEADIATITGVRQNRVKTIRKALRENNNICPSDIIEQDDMTRIAITLRDVPLPEISIPPALPLSNSSGAIVSSRAPVASPLSSAKIRHFLTTVEAHIPRDEQRIRAMLNFACLHPIKDRLPSSDRVRGTSDDSSSGFDSDDTLSPVSSSAVVLSSSHSPAASSSTSLSPQHASVIQRSLLVLLHSLPGILDLPSSAKTDSPTMQCRSQWYFYDSLPSLLLQPHADGPMLTRLIATYQRFDSSHVESGYSDNAARELEQSCASSAFEFEATQPRDRGQICIYAVRVNYHEYCKLYTDWKEDNGDIDQPLHETLNLQEQNVLYLVNVGRMLRISLYRDSAFSKGAAFTAYVPCQDTFYYLDGTPTSYFYQYLTATPLGFWSKGGQRL